MGIKMLRCLVIIWVYRKKGEKIMKYDIIVSFTFDAYKYERYKQICRKNNRTTTNDLNHYMQSIIDRDNDSYHGYRLTFAGLQTDFDDSLDEDNQLAETDRIKKLVLLCMEDNPDIIILTEAKDSDKRKFVRYLKKHNRKICNILVNSSENRNIFAIVKEETDFTVVYQNSQYILLKIRKSNEESIFILYQLTNMESDMTSMTSFISRESNVIVITEKVYPKEKIGMTLNQILNTTIHRIPYDKEMSCYANKNVSRKYRITAETDIRPYEERLSSSVMMKIKIE